MTQWEAVHTTLEISDEVSVYVSHMRIDEVTHYVETLKQQRKEQELEIQTQTGSSSDDLVERLKQLRELDRLIETLNLILQQKQGSLQIQNEEKRTPMEMIRPEYKGMKLPDIAAEVLNQNSCLLTTAELTRSIYETRTDDEFDRARNSLSSELRSGAKVQKPRWKKVGRNAYTAIGVVLEVSV